MFLGYLPDCFLSLNQAGDGPVLVWGQGVSIASALQVWRSGTAYGQCSTLLTDLNYAFRDVIEDGFDWSSLCAPLGASPEMMYLLRDGEVHILPPCEAYAALRG